MRLKIKNNFIYVFPDPNQYGDIVNLSNTKRDNPFNFYFDKSSYKNISSSSSRKTVKANERNHYFHSYQSAENRRINITNNGTFPDSITDLINYGSVDKIETDIYGNEYIQIIPNKGVIKNTSDITVIGNAEFDSGGTIDITENKHGSSIEGLSGLSDKIYAYKEIYIKDAVTKTLLPLSASKFDIIYNKFKFNNKLYNEILENSIYKMQPKKVNNQIEFDQNLVSDEVRILGLYDPEDNGLDINMWSNSDGDQLKNIFAKLKKMEFSEDAKEIMNISVLTNSHYPKKNISSKEFLQFKSDWLIKSSNFDLIKTYLLKNQIIDVQPKLTKFLIDEYLSNFEIKKACEIFSKNLKPINDDYLIRFNIYCLIKDGKDEEAQLIYDLKKEMGFKNEYFENKISYLFKYTDKADEIISEKTIFDFHLAHQTNPNFSFEPNESTKKIIWKYLSSNNLLEDIREIDLENAEKIMTLEKATHEKNYSESYTAALPDFVKLAEAYGCVGIRAKTPNELDEKIKEMINIDKPVIFDCVVDKAENCFPMIPSGKPHNQMILGPEEEKEISDEGKILV